MTYEVLTRYINALLIQSTRAVNKVTERKENVEFVL